MSLDEHIDDLLYHFKGAYSYSDIQAMTLTEIEARRKSLNRILKEKARAYGNK